ncbi:MAG: hypothetical protein MJ135_00835 [Oscillospiraceae bacterium]|nr:hypothetical protein [Oscillospiraceae bacterium]
MKKLFFTGTDASSVLFRLLGSRIAEYGGIVFESCESALTCSKCCFYSPAALAGIEGIEQWNCVQDTPNGIHWDNEQLRTNGVRLLQEASYYPAALLCGIGKSDLIIPQFRVELESILNSDLPCLGVIAPEADIDLMQGLFGLGEKIALFHSNLLSQLSWAPGTKLLTNCTAEKTEAAILEWLRLNQLN